MDNSIQDSARTGQYMSRHPADYGRIYETLPPSKHTGLLNPNFIYTSAANTNIRKTFDRMRAEQAAK
jgi:hypothetical protein